MDAVCGNMDKDRQKANEPEASIMTHTKKEIHKHRQRKTRDRE